METVFGILIFTLFYSMNTSAAIYFKNRIYRAWDRAGNSSYPIGEEDRNIVKQGILHALVTVPNAVQ